MYGRNVGEHTLRFEASGGLLHSSLVMVDKETDTYWSLMTHDALAGELAGSQLKELGLGIKTQWKTWRKRHPHTQVLSVDGQEHVEANPYDSYFQSERTFDGSKPEDPRLAAKASVFGFQADGKSFAVPFEAFEGRGATLTAGTQEVFLHRPKGAEIFLSTRAFVSDEGFERRRGAWIERGTGARFDAESGTFVATEAEAVATLSGFDTFWFNWSMQHPDTRILRD